LRMAQGDVVTFIDDDVSCQPTWLESIINRFKEEGIVGVTGPTIITEEYRKKRDIFKYKTFKRLYDRLFLDNQSRRPSYLSQVGAPSTASNDAGTDYTGPVSFLEACNMSVRRDMAIAVGGFSREFVHTSEWCELDLALRLRQYGVLFYDQRCGLYHKPSQSGIYQNRLKTAHRWKNFVTFQSKWVKPSAKRRLYWAWVRIYLILKQTGLI